MHDVGVDAVRHRHAGHRRPRRLALRHDLRLQLCAVALTPFPTLACHRVHLEIRWTRSLAATAPASRRVRRTLTKQRPAVNIGVDVGKSQLDLYLLERDRALTVPNEEHAIVTLIRAL